MTTANETMTKFGYPGTLLRESEHWVVLLRPAQVTLGSLVLAAKGNATAYGALPGSAFTEQADAVAAIERALKDFCAFERINYLMLMMVDPHVHFHVIPRYSAERSWAAASFPDSGWPGPPDLKSAILLSSEQITALSQELAVRF